MISKYNLNEIISFSLIIIPKYLDKELINSTLYNLDDKSIILLKKILKYYPDVIESSKNILVSIIDDGKIDMKDIPKMIMLINRLYVIIYKMKKYHNFLNTQITSEIAGKIIRFIIYVLLEEGIINIEQAKKEEFVNLTNTLIDTITKLYTIPKLTKNDIRRFSLCSCFFG